MSNRKPRRVVLGFGVPFGFIQDILQGLPVSVPAALAAFSLVAIFQLLMNQFIISLVLPLGLIAAIAAGYYAHRQQAMGATKTVGTERRFFDLCVLAGVGLWLLFNLVFSSQHIFTDRDPATYNLAGAWLINHQSLQISKPDILSKLSIPNLNADSLGFATDPHDGSQLQAQGAHLLPALQGLVGKAFGLSGVLKTNILFGATALMAFYGFARLVVRPRWAALGTLTLALSLPMLFLTRDSYTEPLTLTFIFGGLSLLYYAQTGRQHWQWALAGIVLGAAALARIDAYLVFAGIELAAVILLALTPRGRRREFIASMLWLTVGMLLGGYLAWLDVSGLSSAYYQAHNQYIIPELGLLLVIAVMGIIFVALNWRFRLTTWADNWTRRWRDWPLGIVIGGLFLILASRPIWFVGYQKNYAGQITRSFSEQTMNWIFWYFGPILVVVAVVGLVFIIKRLLRGKDQRLLPFLLAFSATTLLYLLQPDITGDQVWATRRLLPIVLPGFTLLGMWTFQYFFELRRFRLRDRRYDLKSLVTVLVTLTVVSPLFVSYPFMLRRLYVPELSQVQAICAATPKNSLEVWLGSAQQFAVQPTRTICGNDSLGLDSTAVTQQTLASLAAQAQDAGKQVVIGLYDSDSDVLPSNDRRQLSTISTISYNEVEHTYKRAPRNLITITHAIEMGQLSTGGKITPLP